ncbi:unnamed protein product [Gongylonema pulchrum]|uniref:Uncharacterized protein n=1 Tax=Gongylonema pulchrum TaxID=637853 RepID=A0A183EII1_9BILA|nr:unnamed protein product [Gongylonema pulchrum]
MDDFILPEDVDESGPDMYMDDGDQQASLTADGQLVQNLNQKLSVNTCAEVMSDLLKEYKSVKHKLEEIDGLARQVFMQQLSSGSSILTVRLRNDSPFEMINWHLALTAVPFRTATAQQEATFKAAFGGIFLRDILTNAQFGNNFQVFCSDHLRIPLLFRTQLFKCFHLSSNREPCAFRLALEPVYFTHWDMSVPTAKIPETSADRAVLYSRAEEASLL